MIKMKEVEGIENSMTKEEELAQGVIVQRGLEAEELLSSGTAPKEQIEELMELVHAGELAQEYLFDTHIKLAKNRAKWMSRQTGTRYSIEDLNQDAYIALSLAIRTYDPSRNCRLSTHAYRKITKTLSVSINKMRSVRLPENRMGDYLHINKAEAEYISINGGNIDPWEMQEFVIEKTGLSKEVIATIKSAISGSISINTPISEDGGEFGDLLQDDETIEEKDIQNQELLGLLCKLSQEQQDILAYEFGLGKPSVPLEVYMKENTLSRSDVTKASKRLIKEIKRGVKANSNK